jgi:hypothetical protein
MLSCLQPLPDIVEVNGVKLSGLIIPQLIAMVTNPNPNKWYRFERREDNTIQVEVKHDEVLRFSTSQPNGAV